MQVDITGQQLELTESIKDYVELKMKRLSRHFDEVLNAHIILSVEKLRQKAEATLYTQGKTIFAQANDENLYAAIDELADKLDRQIIKHKEKSKSHHQREITHHNFPGE